MCDGFDRDALLQDVVVYVQERRQFGRPLADFQAVQLKLAEMKMKVGTTRRRAAGEDRFEDGLVDP